MPEEHQTSEERAAPGLRWLLASLVVITLDFVSKQAILQNFYHGERLPVTGFFNLVLTYNPGAAFGFLATAGGWQRWLFIVLAALVTLFVVWALRQHCTTRAQAMALSLILGGALGNVVDRLWYGAVVDFLDFHAFGWHWPAFNVADAALTVGVGLLVFEGFFCQKNPPAPPRPES